MDERQSMTEVSKRLRHHKMQWLKENSRYEHLIRDRGCAHQRGWPTKALADHRPCLEFHVECRRQQARRLATSTAPDVFREQHRESGEPSFRGQRWRMAERRFGGGLTVWGVELTVSIMVIPKMGSGPSVTRDHKTWGKMCSRCGPNSCGGCQCEVQTHAPRDPSMPFVPWAQSSLQPMARRKSPRAESAKA